MGPLQLAAQRFRIGDTLYLHSTQFAPPAIHIGEVQRNCTAEVCRTESLRYHGTPSGTRPTRHGPYHRESAGTGGGIDPRNGPRAAAPGDPPCTRPHPVNSARG